ncbi:MAG: 5'/3'-nucleotidase SurE [Clostridia bacterium]|nr:5'/3'-nucleotidase SurE [Clostridia bacterium]
MKILLTNDDGYLSEGLQLLTSGLSEKGHQVYVVAPDSQRSAMSHAVSFYKYLTLTKLDDYCGAVEAYAFSGTPADCVKFAYSTLGVKFDLVISGPNNGANYGGAIWYSGTVSAAEEGAIVGIPSLALSRVGTSGSYASAVEYVVDNVEQLLATYTPNTVTNINVPCLPISQIKGVKVAPCNNQMLFDDFFVLQEDGTWFSTGTRETITEEGCDVVLADDGYITISPVTTLKTHFSAMAKLRELEK